MTEHDPQSEPPADQPDLTGAALPASDPTTPVAGSTEPEPGAAADPDADPRGPDGGAGRGGPPSGPPATPDLSLDRAEGGGSGPRSRTALLAALGVLVVALAAGAWFVAAGGDSGGDGGPGSSSGGGSGPSAWGIRWEVVSITVGGEERPIVAARDGALVVAMDTEGRVSFNGCNGGSGVGQLVDGRLVVADGFVSTDMACTDADGEALMDQDAWMAEFLSSSPEIEIGAGGGGEAETLRLSTDDATLELVARGETPDSSPAPGDPDEPVSNDPDAPSLPDPGHGSSIPTIPGGGADGPDGGSVGGGTPGSPGAAGVWGESWTITGITAPSGVAAVVRPARDGSAPVLDLTAEGRVSFTGCNGGTSSARLDGDRLLVDAMVSTRMACGGPDGEALMAQDVTVTGILEAGPTVTIDGDTLQLSSDVGTLGATREG